MPGPENGKKDLESKPSQRMSADSRRAMELVGVVAAGLVVVIFWVIYLVNPNWITYCFAVGVPLVASFAVYRFKSSLVSESVLLAVNTAIVWLVYFPHPNLLAFLLGTVMLGLMIRNILQYVRGTEREAILESFRQIEKPVHINDRLAAELNPDERYKIVTHYHDIAVMPWVMLTSIWGGACLGWFIKGDLTPWVALALFAVGAAWPASKWALWNRELLCLTTHYRLFQMRGILKTTTPTIDVRKLTDTTPTITRLSTALSWMRFIKAPYGYYVLETAGQDQALTKIGPIPDIKAFKRVINQMMTPRADEGPLE